MQVLEADDWSLLLPPEWSAERDAEGIVIGDDDEVGLIEISELRKDSGPFSMQDLSQFTDQGSTWSAASLGSFTGLGARVEEDETALREWVVYAGDLLLYITYSCSLENRGMDDAAVDELLATLRYAKE